MILPLLGAFMTGVLVVGGGPFAGLIMVLFAGLSIWMARVWYRLNGDHRPGVLNRQAAIGLCLFVVPLSIVGGLIWLSAAVTAGGGP